MGASPATRKFRAWPEYRYLSQWIRIATDGLSDESQRRVLEEITAHFHDAVEDGMSRGQTEEAASEEAVKNLGNPRAARRAFRRTYLTRYQDRIVRDLIAPRKIIWLLRIYLTVAAAGLVALEMRRTTAELDTAYFRAGLAVLMALAVLTATRVPRLFRRGRQRAAVALGAAADTTLWACWIATMELRPSDLSVGNLWLTPAAVILLAANYLPLLRKFGNRADAA